MTLKKDMQDVTKALKGLVQKVEKIQAQVAKLDAPKKAKAVKAKAVKAKAAKAKPVKRAVKKAAAKPKAKTTAKKADTAIATAFTLISRSKKGIDTATLMAKTGYNKKKVANLVFKLKQQGKIKSVGKGVYLKA